ncbi:MAG: hypothetical protein BWK80_17565 [Desulfobacteraceae bacterium IS3]|nr:MAG: hypothetical protein BWK80_17565 [Desulfobacteraceae bacterium IS3]
MFDIFRCIRILITQLSVLFLFSGCSLFVSSATVGLTENLSQAILNNNDPATVEAGAPAYLLMIEGFLNDDPNNESLLRAAATLYAAYTDVFVSDQERAKKMSEKSLNYAFRCLCLKRQEACSLRGMDFQAFERMMSIMKAEDVPGLYTLGTAYAGWIQCRKDDWNAVAEISRVEAIMRRVLDLDENYQDGSAHLYMGVLTTFLPPALGGKPEEGREHFERAIAISGEKNLMIKVLYARHYARLIFDRELHDRLLNEVLKANPDAPGYVLSNTLAQKQAKELLESAGEYF